MNDLARQAHAIIDAFNARDFDAVLSHLDPSYKLTLPYGSFDAMGAGEQDAKLLTAFPDLVFEIANTVTDGSTVVLEVLAVATHTGELEVPGEAMVPPSGASLRLPILFVQKFAGDKLRSERLYFDQLTILRQTGARSRAGRT